MRRITDYREFETFDELQACVAEHFSVSVEHSTFQLERAVHGDHEHETHA